MSAAVGTSSISFSGLRTAWGNASYAGGSDPGSSTISISEFHGATFTSGSPIDANGAGDSVSIDTHFKGRTFGSSATTYYLQINNEGTFNSFQYEISNITSMTSGNQGPNSLLPMGMGDDSSGELVYTDSNTTITITITDSDDNPVDVTGFNAATGLSVPSTPVSGGVFTLTWSATGSSGSPLVLGIST
jgi:hypothetical protein